MAAPFTRQGTRQMDRNARARRVINFVRTVAVKYGRPASIVGWPEEVEGTLVDRFANWTAIISTWPESPAEHARGRIFMPGHIAVWVGRFRVFSGDFDEHNLRIYSFMRGPWDELIFETVKHPADVQ